MEWQEVAARVAREIAAGRLGEGESAPRRQEARYGGRLLSRDRGSRLRRPPGCRVDPRRSPLELLGRPAGRDPSGVLGSRRRGGALGGQRRSGARPSASREPRLGRPWPRAPAAACRASSSSRGAPPTRPPCTSSTWPPDAGTRALPAARWRGSPSARPPVAARAGPRRAARESQAHPAVGGPRRASSGLAPAGRGLATSARAADAPGGRAATPRPRCAGELSPRRCGRGGLGSRRRRAGRARGGRLARARLGPRGERVVRARAGERRRGPRPNRCSPSSRAPRSRRGCAALPGYELTMSGEVREVA